MLSLRRFAHMLLIVGIALLIAGCATKSATTQRVPVPTPPPFKTPRLPAVDCDSVVFETDSDYAFCERVI